MDESYLEWLDAAAGLGPEKARWIAARFPTFEHLRHATREELASVRGLASAAVDRLLQLPPGGPGRSAPTGHGLPRGFLDRWQKVAETADLSPQDRLTEELAYCERLLEADPEIERTWVKKARILEGLGRPREAADALTRAAQLNPSKEVEYRLEGLNLLKAAGGASPVVARWPEQPEATAPPREDARLLDTLHHYEDP